MKRSMFAVMLMLAVAVHPARAADPPVGTTTIFARVGAPGMPEGIAVRDGIVYVGTHVSIAGNQGGPASKIFTFDLATGAALGEITVQGQDLSVTHGILAMAFDAAGVLYVVDRNPGRIVRIDPASGAQTVYATIPNLPACRPVVGPQVDCSPTVLDSATFADYLAFDADGTAYVTDLEAATIFRVPPGGGPAQIWYQDAVFDGLFGLNGIAVDPSGTHLYFAMTGSQQPGSPAQGVIYTLPIVDSLAPADLRVFHTLLQPAAGADGIAFGASGKLYVALAGANQVAILNPDGSEAAIFPDPIANQLQEIPYDLPASIAFDGQGSILVTNQSFFAADSDHWAVFRAWVGDTALSLIEPVL
ncbi:MAG TPA: SMP-30/gluconolactonase/LRE family protein [Actinomycetota bacterium]